MHAIELRDVSKRYDGVVRLAPTNLSVVAGRTLVLIGPSGCGKSTLLRLMLGLLAPDTGDVLLDGQPLRADRIATQRHRMGYVIQDGGLFPHLRAHDNVALLARHLGWTRPRIDDRLQQLATLVRLPLEALQRFPSQLSGGQRQRVGLMRALMLDPSVILLDEPLGALDPLVRMELQTDLREIFRALSKTVVMVTHDLREAVWFADEIVLMRDGQIVQRGTVEAMKSTPSDPFVTRFLQAWE